METSGKLFESQKIEPFDDSYYHSEEFLNRESLYPYVPLEELEKDFILKTPTVSTFNNLPPAWINEGGFELRQYNQLFRVGPGFSYYNFQPGIPGSSAIMIDVILDAVQNSVYSTNNRINYLSDRIDRKTSSLDTLISNAFKRIAIVENTTGDITRAHSRIDSLSSRITGVNDRVDILSNRISTVNSNLTSEINRIDGRADALSTRLSNANSARVADIEVLNKELTKQTGRIDTISTRLTNANAARVADIEALDKQINNRVDLISSRLTTANADRVSDIKNTNERLDSISTRLTNANADRVVDLRLANDRIDILSTRISKTNDDRVSDINGIKTSMLAQNLINAGTFAIIDNRLDKVDIALMLGETKFGKVDKRIDKLEDSLKNLEALEDIENLVGYAKKIEKSTNDMNVRSNLMFGENGSFYQYFTKLIDYLLNGLKEPLIDFHIDFLEQGIMIVEAIRESWNVIENNLLDVGTKIVRMNADMIGQGTLLFETISKSINQSMANADYIVRNMPNISIVNPSFDYDRLKSILKDVLPSKDGTESGWLKALIETIGSVLETGIETVGKLISKALDGVIEVIKDILKFLDNILDKLIEILIPKNLDFIDDGFKSIQLKLDVKFGSLLKLGVDLRNAIKPAKKDFFNAVSFNLFGVQFKPNKAHADLFIPKFRSAFAVYIWFLVAMYIYRKITGNGDLINEGGS